MAEATKPAATARPRPANIRPMATAPQITPRARNGRLSAASQRINTQAARSLPVTMTQGDMGVFSKAGKVRCSRSCEMEPALASGPRMTKSPSSENTP